MLTPTVTSSICLAIFLTVNRGTTLKHTKRKALLIPDTLPREARNAIIDCINLTLLHASSKETIGTAKIYTWHHVQDHMETSPGLSLEQHWRLIS